MCQAAVWLELASFARVVEVYARRLQIQEKTAAQIANTINDVLKPQGPSDHQGITSMHDHARGA